MSASPALSRNANVVAWVLSVLLALAFLGSGGSKLAGVQMHVENFARWGFPPFFLYVTGVVEVASALLLLVPATAAFGGALLVPTMLVAALVHATHGELPMTVPPLVLLLLSAAVTWLRRGTLRALLRRAPGTATA